MSVKEGRASLCYVSDLARDAPRDAVASITRSSRRRNALDGVSGLLAFDGACFAQLVQGSAAAIHALRARLESDSRHTNMDILVAEPLTGSPRFPDWHLGYLLIEGDEIGVACLRGTRGAQALAAFDRLVLDLDVDAATREPAAL